ncbi:ribosomal-protein-S5-alanine N-acetyltransferase [compost metagenome]
MYVCGGIIPALRGSGIELRPLAVIHALELFEIWTHPAVAPWLDAPPLSTPDDAEQLIELLRQMSREEESLRWSIAAPGGRIIGSCGYNQWQLSGAFRGEVGCELAPDCWGQGYMSEALRLMLKFGFGTMGLNRIEALCHPDNVRAEKLFKGQGFRQEGRLRQYRHTATGFQDVIMYALLHGERDTERED